MTISELATCEECSGTGKWNDYDGHTVLDCDTCGGTGKVAPPTGTPKPRGLTSGVTPAFAAEVAADEAQRQRPMSERSAPELAAEMHDLSVHLWNALERENPQAWMISNLRQQVEETQHLLKVLSATELS